jgi:hypothetical protein
MKTKSANPQESNRIVWKLECFAVMWSLLWSVVAQAQLFTLDDGSVNTFGGTPSGDLLALNHFNTGGPPVLIDETLSWFSVNWKNGTEELSNQSQWLLSF